MATKQVADLLFNSCFTLSYCLACRKIDYKRDKEQTPAEIAEKFFNVPATADPTIKRIAVAMKAYNNKHDFITSLVKKRGYAIWDKSPVLWGYKPSIGRGEGGGQDPDTLALIPLVQAGRNRVVSFLAATRSGGNDTTRIRIFNADEYFRYGKTNDWDTLSAESVAITSMYLEKNVFSSNDTFRIIDKGLFSFDNSFWPDTVRRLLTFDTTTNGHGGGGGGRNNLGPTIIVNGTEHCTPVWINVPCEGARTSTSNGSCHEVYNYCWTTSWVQVVNTNPGLIVWGGGGGIGDLDQTVNCSNFAAPECGGPPHFGWYPLEEEPNGYDPSQPDSVRVDNEILDSFPCIYHLIKDTLYNVNGIVENSMQQFFTLNMRNHIYFQINWAFDCSSPFNAYTKPNGVRSVVNGIVHWTDTIQLNPCFLRTASKEKIVQVLIHEPIHAYISWCIKDYNSPSPTIDSNYLKEHFGIYWEWLTQKPYNHVGDHDLMVHNFLRYMSNIIMQHSNPNAPTTLRRWVADKLSASGLQGASAWGEAPDVIDTCNIYAVDYWSRFYKAGSAPVNPFYFGTCRTYNNLFRDSLQMLRGDSCQ